VTRSPSAYDRTIQNLAEYTIRPGDTIYDPSQTDPRRIPQPPASPTLQSPPVPNIELHPPSQPDSPISQPDTAIQRTAPSEYQAIPGPIPPPESPKTRSKMARLGIDLPPVEVQTRVPLPKPKPKQKRKADDAPPE